MERADAHFVECGGGIEVSWVHHEETGGGTPGTPAVPATYKYTYISENGAIWGVPLIDGSVITMNAGPAVEVAGGGGIVGIAYNNLNENGDLRFVTGNTIRINGSVNYDGEHTLTAGTTGTQLQFADFYVAEVFAGTETIVRNIGSLTNGPGCMTQDSLGNLYYGHNWNDPTYVTKIEPDGTQVNDFLNTSWPVGGTSSFCHGLALSDDETYLYLWLGYGSGVMEKYDLSTGDLVWQAGPPGALDYPSYDMDVDSQGNAYAKYGAGAADKVVKFAAASGAKTFYSGMHGAVVVKVDDDLQLLMNAGTVSGGANLWVRALDTGMTDNILLGDTWIGTGCLQVHDGFIYVLGYDSGVATLYKVSWDGTNLAIVTSVAAPTYGCGFYFDLWDNLVIINQDWIVSQDDVFWFYDTDFNYLSKAENFYNAMLRSWDSAAGWNWQQGSALFLGDLGTPEVPEIPGTDDYWQVFDTEGNELLLPGLVGEEVAILADGVVMPNQIVDDNGRIDCSGFPNVRKLHWGLAYESKLKPMKPVSQPDMMSAVVTCKEMGISVHNTDDIKYGVHDDDMHDINFDDVQWKNKSEIDGLFTGTVAVNVPDGFSVNLPLQITTSAPLPATVRAMIPKVDQTGD